MNAKEARAQKENIMRYLHVSAEEAEQIMEYDKGIDRNQRMPYDLSVEDEKRVIKEAHKGTKERKPTIYKFDQRKRKENPTKQSIISELAKFLEKQSENACTEVNITNKERQIAFSIGDQKYELTLVAKRPPKK